MQNVKKTATQTVAAKKDATPAAPAAAPAPVAAATPAAAAAPVAAAAAKKAPVAKKEVAKKEVAVEPVPEPAEAVVAAVEPASTEQPALMELTENPEASTEDDILAMIDAEIENMESTRKELTVRLQNMRKIRKSAQVMSKKVTKKGAKKNTNKKPSGINLGIAIGEISAPLAAFMKEQPGNNDLQTVSRIDALKSINSYIKTKALQNPANKQHINLDATMKKLFPTFVASKNPLKYTDIMGALGQHFPKKTE